MNNDPEKILKNLFALQNFAVLATAADEIPYTNIVAFASSDNLRHLAFFTPVKTSKYERIQRNSHVSLFIDNRSNRAADITESIGVTVIGMAVDMDSEARDMLVHEFIKKHPGLKNFAESPESAMITVNVERYHIVSNFQDVIVLNIK